eukprot:TRINITY_DN7262_c0_g1_i1.p1 TRINITY_DN7262_c0_g1~~TRINITY_DN7262_c0_g1_i1.p1  ORF type:complete len:145 (+),score=45.58 TRINITY_DN7262_c0_g1_i1:23-457(+)
MLLTSASILGAGIYWWRHRRSAAPALLHARELTQQERASVVDCYRYVVVDPVEDTVAGQLVTVEKWFLVEGTCGEHDSIDAATETRWLVHEWLYATHGVASKADADSALAAALPGALVAQLCTDEAWHDRHKRGPQFLHTEVKY